MDICYFDILGGGMCHSGNWRNLNDTYERATVNLMFGPHSDDHIGLLLYLDSRRLSYYSRMCNSNK